MAAHRGVRLHLNIYMQFFVALSFASYRYKSLCCAGQGCDRVRFSSPQCRSTLGSCAYLGCSCRHCAAKEGCCGAGLVCQTSAPYDRKNTPALHMYFALCHLFALFRRGTAHKGQAPVPQPPPPPSPPSPILKAPGVLG